MQFNYKHFPTISHYIPLFLDISRLFSAIAESILCYNHDRIGLPLAYHVNTTKLKDRISNSLNYSMWSEGQLQPYWYPNFPDGFKDDYFKMFEAEHKVDEYDRKTNQYLRTIWKERPGVPNHAFDTFVYSLAALEIFATDCCYQVFGVKGINWELFWQHAKEGNFYEE